MSDAQLQSELARLKALRAEMTSEKPADGTDPKVIEMLKSRDPKEYARIMENRAMWDKRGEKSSSEDRIIAQKLRGVLDQPALDAARKALSLIRPGMEDKVPDTYAGNEATIQKLAQLNPETGSRGTDAKKKRDLVANALATVTDQNSYDLAIDNIEALQPTGENWVSGFGLTAIYDEATKAKIASIVGQLTKGDATTNARTLSMARKVIPQQLAGVDSPEELLAAREILKKGYGLTDDQINGIGMPAVYTPEAVEIAKAGSEYLMGLQAANLAKAKNTIKDNSKNLSPAEATQYAAVSAKFFKEIDVPLQMAAACSKLVVDMEFAKKDSKGGLITGLAAMQVQFGIIKAFAGPYAVRMGELELFDESIGKFGELFTKIKDAKDIVAGSGDIQDLASLGRAVVPIQEVAQAEESAVRMYKSSIRYIKEIETMYNRELSNLQIDAKVPEPDYPPQPVPGSGAAPKEKEEVKPAGGAIVPTKIGQKVG